MNGDTVRTLAMTLGLTVLATVAGAEIRVHIRVEEDQGVPVLMVQVSDSNGEYIDVSGVGFVKLRAASGEFWAPFDLEHLRPVGPNTTSRLVLAARDRRSRPIDLTILRWGKTIAATWPSESLRTAVPPGTYAAQIVIELKGGWRTTSNVVDLMVTYSGQGAAQHQLQRTAAPTLARRCIFLEMAR